VSLPVAFTVFPGEIFRAPRGWAEQVYPNLVYFNEVGKGGDITRTDLQEHDLSTPGRIVIQNRVELSHGAQPIRHQHPGEEVIYVLEGTLEYAIDGIGTRAYNAGEALPSRPTRFTRYATSATAPRRSSPHTSSRRTSRSSCRPTDSGAP
jgi:hypothetical protein